MPPVTRARGSQGGARGGRGGRSGQAGRDRHGGRVSGQPRGGRHAEPTEAQVAQVSNNDPDSAPRSTPPPTSNPTSGKKRQRDPTTVPQAVQDNEDAELKAAISESKNDQAMDPLQAAKSQVAHLKDLQKAVKGMEWPRTGMSCKTDKLRPFLRRFEEEVLKYGGSPADMLTIIGRHLTGEAYDWYDAMKSGPDSDIVFRSWEQFKTSLTQEYQPEKSYSLIHQDLDDCKKLDNEDYSTHLLRFKSILRDWPEDSQPSARHQIEVYLRSLPVDVARGVRTSYRAQLDALYTTLSSSSALGQHSSKPPTLMQVSQWAEAIHRELREELRFTPPSTARQQPSNAVVVGSTIASGALTSAPSLPPPGSRYQGKRYDPNFYHKKQKTESQPLNPPPSSAPTAASPTPPTAPTSTPNVVRPLGPQDSRTSPRVCYFCKRPGHIKQNCREWIRLNAGQPPNPRK